MRISVKEVLGQLQAEGLATADTEVAAREALGQAAVDDIPWYIRLAAGIGAWTATGFFLGFLLAIAGLDDDTARIVVGLLLAGAAVVVRRGPAASSEFVRQAAIATSLSGQALVLVGVHDFSDSTLVACLAGVVLSTALILLMPDSVHRFLSAIIGTVCALVAAVELRRPLLFEVTTLALVGLAALAWRVGVRRRSTKTDDILTPVGFAVIVVLFGTLVFGTQFGDIAGELTHRRGDLVLGPLTTLGITLALVGLVWKIVDEHGASPRSGAPFAAIAGVIALGAGAMRAPGIVAGAAVLVLAFDRRNAVLLGMAVAFLLAFGSSFYYNLHLTLLEKSGVLFGSGLLLLAIRNRIVPRATSDGEAPA